MKYLLLILVFISSSLAYSQSSQIWKLKPHSPVVIPETDRMMGALPSSCVLFEVSLSDLELTLKGLSDQDGSVISLPNPTGEMVQYELYENSVVSEDVSSFYTIKTYKGNRVDNENVSIRCDITQQGFRAVIYDGKGTYVVEPINKLNSSEHVVYYKNELEIQKIACKRMGADKYKSAFAQRGTTRASATSLRTFDIAITAAGEYSQQFGGAPYSSTNVLNAIASGVNLMNPIFNRDLGLEFNLVSTPDLIFENAATDPFDFSDQSVLLDTNQTVIDRELGSANYDIGHLLVWSNEGGLAGLGVVCEAGRKAKGFSGNNFSINSLFIDYVSHEIGHQLYADHNFSAESCAQSVTDYRFEPGEGSSIMSYAGICDFADSYQSSVDPYFHTGSIDDMQFYIDTWGGCESNSVPGAGNASEPVVDDGGDITIPMQTAFVLVGSATDGNDASSLLTYSWEQYDNQGGETVGPPDCTSTDEPLFKFIDPVSESFRVFPNMVDVLTGDNNDVDFEKLPCTTRDIDFRFVVRDNNPNWGRIGQSNMEITVANTGPFAISSPDGSETYFGNSTQTITWTVNGTDSHCPTVDILLSDDSGLTYSILETNVTNDGAQDVVLPNSSSTTVRVLVQCSTGENFRSASTFFDVSNADLSIVQSALPVDFLAFDVNQANDKNVLSWTVTNEKVDDYYTVQRSFDGVSFTDLVEIDGTAQSEDTAAYSYDDILQQIAYYRIQQVSVGNVITYSEVILVESEDIPLALFPNPSQDFFYLSGTVGEVEVYVYNTLGEIVARYDQPSTDSFDIIKLSAGIYKVSTKDELGTENTFKLVKL